MHEKFSTGVRQMRCTNRFSRQVKLVVMLMGAALGASRALAQEPLQFKVPYQCSDGTVYTIVQCTPRGNAEICDLKQEKNGQLITERYIVRTQMYGMLKACPVKSGAQAAKPSSGPLDPPYLAEFPSVERVMRELKGSDEQDTKLKQTGAFRQLKQILEDTTGSRWYHNQLTADEKRIYGEYDLAYNQLAKPLNYPLGGYGTDPKFRQELFQKFSMARVRAQFDSANAQFEARHQQRLAAEKKQLEDAQAASAAAAAKANGTFERNDPGTLAVRRCIELGGNELTCLGKGLMVGALDLGGLNPDLFNPAVRGGLRMTGLYKGAAPTTLGFREDNVTVDGCGKLVSDGHGYAIEKKGETLVITVKNEPRAFVVTWGPDGRVTGPGLTDVKGQVIVGYHNIWVEQRRVSDNSIVPGTGHVVQEPILEDRTERCTIGALSPAGPTYTMTEALEVVFKTLAGQPTEAKERAEKEATAPGPRMAGSYSGQGGFKIEFQPAAAILDCGEAHVTQPYKVANTPNQVLITVKNGATPFTLTLQQDGRLTGSGVVDVMGRVVAGATDNNIVYAAKNARCTLGSLMAAGGGSGPNAAGGSTGAKNAGAVASATQAGVAEPAAVQPAGIQPGAVPPPTALPAIPAQDAGANATVTISSGFPANANPLAGRTLFLMKESFDVVLKKVGAPYPEGTPIIDLWQQLSGSCHPPVDCTPIYQAIASYKAAQVTLGKDGGGTLAPNVAAGTYYVSGTAVVNGRPAAWNLRMQVRPGENSVTLDQNNLAPSK